MFRALVLAILTVTVVAPSASAQQWAQKMFLKCDTPLSHDFGVVAKDSKVEHFFEFQNIFEEDIHVASVRSSCRCTQPQIVNDTLKTWEKSAIRAVFNTKSYLGRGSATLTVVIDRPYYAEVQLSVRGYIRGDVLFTPGAVSFGEVEYGQRAEQRVQISHAGRSNWDITDVRSANPHFEVELDNRQSNLGNVTYMMTVRLKDDAPVGYIQDQLTIVTNESYNGTLELPVEGRVVSPLSVSPASLFLGVVKPGEVVRSKKLVVRGTKPFRVTGIECPGDCFQFQIPEDAKTLHVIPLTFTAGKEPGKLSATIQVQTDLGTSAQCAASATITARARMPATRPPTTDAIGPARPVPGRFPPGRFPPLSTREISIRKARRTAS